MKPHIYKESLYSYAHLPGRKCVFTFNVASGFVPSIIGTQVHTGARARAAE